MLQLLTHLNIISDIISLQFINFVLVNNVSNYSFVILKCKKGSISAR